MVLPKHKLGRDVWLAIAMTLLGLLIAAGGFYFLRRDEPGVSPRTIRAEQRANREAARDSAALIHDAHDRAARQAHFSSAVERLAADCPPGSIYVIAPDLPHIRFYCEGADGPIAGTERLLDPDGNVVPR